MLGRHCPIWRADSPESGARPPEEWGQHHRHLAAERKLLPAMLNKLKIPQPPNGLATNETEALQASRQLGYPVLVRPLFVLGGRAMQIVYSDSELTHYMKFAVEASPERPVLVDKFLEDATEVDVDCITDVGQF